MASKELQAYCQFYYQKGIYASCTGKNCCYYHIPIGKTCQMCQKTTYDQMEQHWLATISKMEQKEIDDTKAYQSSTPTQHTPGGSSGSAARSPSVSSAWQKYLLPALKAESAWWSANRQTHSDDPDVLEDHLHTLYTDENLGKLGYAKSEFLDLIRNTDGAIKNHGTRSNQQLLENMLSILRSALDEGLI